MFSLSMFLIISLAWFMLLRNIFNGLTGSFEDKNYRLLNDLKNLSGEKNKVDLENSMLSKTFEDTLALYELTKDICQSLEEEKVFSIFNKNLKKYVGIGDCRYIKDAQDLIKYKDYTILPLNIDSDQVAGYLAIDRINESDKEKFGILAQQFSIGLRRALLYQKVQGLTITDTLTQIYCRRYFLERFHEELKRSKKNKLFLSFLMIDIDNFKQFNDRYGHLVGDGILRQVSKIITDSIRQIDFTGRYGGEELSAVLAETDREQAKFAAERIRQAIEAAVIKVYDERLKVTVSIGISTFPFNSPNMKELIDLADQALYLAKETGKNRVCFSPS